MTEFEGILERVESGETTVTDAEALRRLTSGNGIIWPPTQSPLGDGMRMWARIVADNVRRRGYLHGVAGLNALGQSLKMIEESAELALTMENVPEPLAIWLRGIKLMAGKYFRTLPAAIGLEPLVTYETRGEGADMLVVMACLLDTLSYRWPVNEQVAASIEKSADDTTRGAEGWED